MEAFNSRFFQTESLPEYRYEVELLMMEFADVDLSEFDIVFITNFLITMELYFVIAKEVLSNNNIASARTEDDCNWWCETKNFLSDVGDCAGDTLEAIASNPVYSGATVVATASTGGAAVAYGLAGIAIGCTINVAMS